MGPLFIHTFVSCSNWGTEVDENQAYHNGNSDPRGFGKSGPSLDSLKDFES